MICSEFLNPIPEPSKASNTKRPGNYSITMYHQGGSPPFRSIHCSHCHYAVNINTTRNTSLRCNHGIEAEVVSTCLANIIASKYD
jgi:hypothetical protein